MLGAGHPIYAGEGPLADSPPVPSARWPPRAELSAGSRPTPSKGGNLRLPFINPISDRPVHPAKSRFYRNRRTDRMKVSCWIF